MLPLKSYLIKAIQKNNHCSNKCFIENAQKLLTSFKSHRIADPMRKVPRRGKIGIKYEMDAIHAIDILVLIPMFENPDEKRESERER